MLRSRLIELRNRLQVEHDDTQAEAIKMTMAGDESDGKVYSFCAGLMVAIRELDNLIGE